MARTSQFVRAQQLLKTYIQEHGLTAGDRLPPEGELAELFEVSRGAIREASRSLQTLGVITAQHGNGLYVADFSFQPIVDQLPYGLAAGARFAEVLQAREALETGLMPEVAALAAPADLDRCEELTRRMSVLVEAGESSIDVDKAFHLALYACLDNPLVNNLIETFWELYRRLYAGVPDVASRADTVQRHRSILAALRTGDALLAMQRMREHFDDLRDRTQAR